MGAPVPELGSEAAAEANPAAMAADPKTAEQVNKLKKFGTSLQLFQDKVVEMTLELDALEDLNDQLQGYLSYHPLYKPKPNQTKHYCVGKFLGTLGEWPKQLKPDPKPHSRKK